jgi:hypothetical protein
VHAPVAEITGDSHERLIDRLVKLAAAIGYTVQITDTGPLTGTAMPPLPDPDRRAARAQRTARRTHPRLALAHALVAADPEAPQLSYAEGELIAESVA